MKKGYVYIMGNYQQNTYIGVTSNLVGRVWEHKQKVLEGHTKKHNLYKLLYFEEFDSIEEAIAREKQLKNWHRQWKIDLIQRNNPTFQDLYEDLLD